MTERSGYVFVAILCICALGWLTWQWQPFVLKSRIDRLEFIVDQQEHEIKLLQTSVSRLFHGDTD